MGAEARTRKPRAGVTVTSLDALVGAHPDALRDFYEQGRPCDPARVGRAEGLVLGVAGLAEAHAATGPLVRAVARHFSLWKGKAFESGGTSGANVFLGRRALRFRSEVAPSLLDGQPTLALRYDGLDNPWPASRLADELREVGPGVVLGPLLWLGGDGRAQPVVWWGLTPEG